MVSHDVALLQSQNILNILGSPSAQPTKPEPANKSAGNDLLDLLGDVDFSAGAGSAFIRQKVQYTGKCDVMFIVYNTG